MSSVSFAGRSFVFCLILATWLRVIPDLVRFRRSNLAGKNLRVSRGAATANRERTVSGALASQQRFASPPRPLTSSEALSQAKTVRNNIRKYLARQQLNQCHIPAVCQDRETLISETPDGRRWLRTDPTVCSIIVGEVKCKSSNQHARLLSPRKPPCSCHAGRPFWGLPATIQAKPDLATCAADAEVLFPTLNAQQSAPAVPPTSSSTTASGATTPANKAAARTFTDENQKQQRQADLVRWFGEAKDDQQSCGSCSSCTCEFDPVPASGIFAYFNFVKRRVFDNFYKKYLFQKSSAPPQPGAVATETRKIFPGPKTTISGVPSDGRIRVLAIGLGVGWIQQTLTRLHPAFDILTVELDAHMLQTAKSFFGLGRTMELGWKTDADFDRIKKEFEEQGAPQELTQYVGRNRVVVSDGLAFLEKEARRLLLGEGDRLSPGMTSKAASKENDRVLTSSAVTRDETETARTAATTANLHASVRGSLMYTTKNATAHHVNKYDLVIVDCFDPLGHVPSPSCVSDRFTTAVYNVLKPKGVMLQNTLNTMPPRKAVEKLKKRFQKVTTEIIPSCPNVLVRAEKVVDVVNHGGQRNLDAAGRPYSSAAAVGQENKSQKEKNGRDSGTTANRSDVGGNASGDGKTDPHIAHRSTYSQPHQDAHEY
ncbi:unnamed protein product [Amoebophrya sp. A120]|nr:unnamed protein product [Amoebophrya sp. A120]|eukprot:GSA120T00001326001.1